MSLTQINWDDPPPKKKNKNKNKNKKQRNKKERKEKEKMKNDLPSLLFFPNETFGLVCFFAF